MSQNRQTISRRDMVLRLLFGPSMLGLRSLATGIPLSILANPRKAFADGPPACANSAQYVVMSTSGSGDPLNANVPGMYDDANIAHPVSSTMAPTSMTLSGTTTKAALPWTQLPQTLLDRSVFFHHGTYTVVHGDEKVTMTLHGAVKRQDMLVSSLATQLAPCLQTVQTEPLALGGTTIYAQGRPQPILAPSALASVLVAPGGVLGKLQQIRDTHLDQLNAFFKSRGTAAQRAFVDQFASSHDQVRAVSQSLLSTLAGIHDNSVKSQLAAAVTLIQMNVAPVITIGIPWGGDNHVDTDLNNEATQTVAGVAAIGSLYDQLASADLDSKVSFMATNVFGRTLSTKGTTGRDHQANHHCTVMIGSALKGGVVGGVTAMANDFGAMAIDSQTGAAVRSGDIPFLETFAAVGKTFGAAVGVPSTFLDENITGGKVVQGALKTV